MEVNRGLSVTSRMTLVMSVLKRNNVGSRKSQVYAWGKELTHKDPTANMHASPIFCCSGIFNLTTIGMGMIKMKTSVTMLVTAVAT